MRKPMIRISTLSRAYVCSGQGVTGSGWTVTAAYDCWRLEMIAKGKQDLIHQ